jgi:hypothetical protein
VARQDGAGLVDQDRVGPDPLDALHQADDLAFRMLPGIARKLLQVPNRTPDDPFRQAAGLALLCIGEIADLARRLKLRVLVQSLRAPISSPNRGEAPRTRELWGNFLCVAICRLSLFVEN